MKKLTADQKFADLETSLRHYKFDPKYFIVSVLYDVADFQQKA